MKVRVLSPSCFMRMLHCLPIILLAAIFPRGAAAALGGDMESVQADQAAMNASQRISAATDNYTVYELQLPTGTIVREYLSMSGTVFAVAWQGPLLPDLHQLLGAKFKDYTDAAAARHADDGRHADHGHLDIQLPDLVVESNGRVRAFYGRAYLPQSLPQDVAVTDIQ